MDNRNNAAFFIAMLAIIAFVFLTIAVDHRLRSLEEDRPEIGTALTCENVSGVVVCVER